jgi:hypothetical protein
MSDITNEFRSIQALQVMQIAVTARGFAQVTNSLAEQHATLSGMTDMQARKAAHKNWLAQMQQLAYVMDESLKHMAGINPGQWDEESWNYFFVVPDAFEESKFSAEIFPDLEYKRLAKEVVKSYADLEARVLAEAPRERAAAETRYRDKCRLEAEAAAALEQRRQVEELERQKREALERSIASAGKTALIVTLVGFFCFQLAIPVGVFLAVRARRRAKRQAPNMVASTNAAFYLGMGICVLAGICIAAVVAIKIFKY